jgi:hypothetical protein
MNKLKCKLSLLLEKRVDKTKREPVGRTGAIRPKKDGGLRMCLDYHAIYKFTIKIKCLIPRIDEIFDRLQGKQYFTFLDLGSDYYQIRMTDTDTLKTCIRTRYGSFEFLVIPYGL